MGSIGRMLLVEDDPKDVELTLEALREFGLANEVVVARDGVEALDYLHRRGVYADVPQGNPAVVLLDLKMPRLGGLEMLEALRSTESLRVVPVVVLTSSREPRDLQRCYDLGVNAYVVKPVRFHDFMDAIKRLGVFWALLNEPPAGSARR